MKQFNLAEYLKNPERKIVTRDGRNVRIHCTNCVGTLPVIAEIEGLGYSSYFGKDGGCYFRPSPCDLFFAPEKHEGWINIYRTEGDEFVYTANVYNSKEEAEDEGRGEEDYIATIKIEWEE